MWSDADVGLYWLETVVMQIKGMAGIVKETVVDICGASFGSWIQRILGDAEEGKDCWKHDVILV